MYESRDAVNPYKYQYGMYDTCFFEFNYYNCYFEMNKTLEDYDPTKIAQSRFDCVNIVVEGKDIHNK